ncbi:hypothetical protein SAMN04488124_2698 [Halogeometricum limi]|uniref:DUF7835 domain-containing protein n=1 Tax=Halogeometricum limi TaxID=555875 RepID=A0A1I6I1H5_9EURY|nr:hypothetical protein SAMN04488124_2698 [Halogeometricum limi]
MSHQTRDPHSPASTRKYCPRCDEPTERETSIRIGEDTRRENVQAENEKFSRQPHLVHTCIECGRSTTEKVD